MIADRWANKDVVHTKQPATTQPWERKKERHLQTLDGPRHYHTKWRPRGYHTKWRTSEGERQALPCGIYYVTRVNLSTKQKQMHRQGAEWGLPRGRTGWGGADWDSAISRCEPAHLEWRNTKMILRSRELQSIPCSKSQWQRRKALISEAQIPDV